MEEKIKLAMLKGASGSRGLVEEMQATIDDLRKQMEDLNAQIERLRAENKKKDEVSI